MPGLVLNSGRDAESYGPCLGRSLYRFKHTALTNRFVLSNQDDIVTVASLDSGKTRVDALFGEILVTVEKLKWTIDHGERALQPEKRPTNFLMFYKQNTVVFEPLGVVAACVSWKYVRPRAQRLMLILS